MMAILKRIKNNLFLTLVVLTYLLLLVFRPELANDAFHNSLYYVKEMLTIMPVILLLTSLIEAWVPKKAIEGYLGEKTGARGFIFSLLLGSFSAGPIYAAFPICKTLLKKGASIANIVVILSAWAVIKVPMLINEIKFLGVQFMGVRWVLTTLSIFTMAVITAKVVKKDELPMEQEVVNKVATLTVDHQYCIGCGLCAKIAPEYFSIIDKKAVVSKELLKEQAGEEVEQAREKCPAQAIKYANLREEG